MPENMNLLSQPPRSADVLTREIPHSEALDFVSACNVLAAIFAKEAPDVVFIPQRGASPMQWTTSALLGEYGKRQPVYAELPLGTHTLGSALNTNPTRQSGLNNEEKQKVIHDCIQKLKNSGQYTPGKSKLMLVDEVQKGGTITQATRLIKDSMVTHNDDSILTVVAIQDSRNGLIGSNRTASYNRLASNQTQGVKTYVQPSALFMVDVRAFLDTILSTESEPGMHSLADLVTVENINARRTFKALARVYANPELALQEIEMIASHDLARDLGTAILQTEMLEAMTDPVSIKPRSRQASDKQIIDWWKNFANSVLVQKTSAPG